ncbi:MAG: cytidylate kinase family protein [Agathobacter sp.]|nr:cytidylate kinase family protein [Agathobacter sp.]
MYFIGLFVMTIGIALSVKSNLGVSPVSSIPYTITCVWGIEMGKATILFHIVLVLIQILVLRKNFKPVQLLQILIGVVFGYFTTFCNYLVSFLPTPDNLGIRILMVLASTVFVAVGIFLYLPADLIPLAGEGCMQAVSTVTHIEFAKVKIGFDCTMVLVSAVTCLTVLHSLGSVGIGTIIAAVLVGTLVGIINRAFGRQRDRLLGKTDEPVATAEEAASNYVITISREFGSGGREIGKLLAKQLGYHYYDSELIRLAAEKSGYTPEYVEQNEQALKNPVLHDFFAWYAGPLEQTDLPKVDQLFQKESALIRELSRNGSCIIVGRLANYVLRDLPTAYHIFISADAASEATRVCARDHISPEAAAAKVKKVNHERAVHCKHFTKTDWGNVKNYDLCIKSDDFGVNETAQIIADLFKKKMKL